MNDEPNNELDAKVTLARMPEPMGYGGAETVTYRVYLAGRWVGWVGDARPWRGWRWGSRRWWACWRQDGDQAARWNTGLDHTTRAAAVAALLHQIAQPGVSSREDQQ